MGAPRTNLSRLSGGDPRRVPQGSSHCDGRVGGAHGWAVHAAMCVKSCQKGRVRWAGEKSSEGDASCATTTQRIAIVYSAEERPARALPALRAARRGREEMTKYGDVKNNLITMRVEKLDKVTLFNNKIASNMSLSVCLCSKM